jgi:hypothetical protein
MSDTHKIITISISTQSTAPLRGILQIETAASTTAFELNGDMAHEICAELEHFLTQGRPPRPGEAGTANSPDDNKALWGQLACTSTR